MSVAHDPLRDRFSLYIHWPFCLSKCPYCDFNSWVTRTPPDQKSFLAAYKSSIDHLARHTDYQHIHSVFFGGGTPSIMEAFLVEDILAHASKYWSFESACEITLEANPGSSDAHKFEAFSKAGVNRLSLGIQSLDKCALQALGRQHSVQEALHAINLAKQYFSRYSLDFIYAREGQNLAEWERELEQVLVLCHDHLSLYQLTIEPETVFAKRYARGELSIPDDDLAQEFLQLTSQKCKAAGLPAYEISNHARRGQESRHNLVYWRYQSYAGIGPGAHGRLFWEGKWRATSEIKNPEKWLGRVKKNKYFEIEELTRSEQADEILLMGLRLSEGIKLQDFFERTGFQIPIKKIDDLLQAGFVKIDADEKILKIGRRGRFVMNGVVNELSLRLI